MVLAELRQLLPHLSTAHNVRWRVGGVVDGKIQADYSTRREPVTDFLFQRHFEGQEALSVQPILDDGHACQWGVIDIDSYDDPGLEQKVRNAFELFKIRPFIEVSKSGGLHVYIILDQPVAEAAQLRSMLKRLARWIGYPDAEIFPKQSKLAIEQEDTGSFVVLPGYGLGVEEAYRRLSASVIPLAVMNELTDEGDFANGPPCLFPLQRLYSAKGWENRNLYLYQLGVFLRYKYPADWQDRLRQYNAEVIAPSLAGAEVEALIGSLEKGNCHYKCNGQPFEEVCNRPLCQYRKFGVAAREAAGDVLSDEGITVLETDPPTWFVSLVNPATNEVVRCAMTTDQLTSTARFKKRCMEVIKYIPQLPKQNEWEAMVAKLLETADSIPVPFEMTPYAELLDCLYRFCLTHPKISEPEGLLRGRVWITDEGDSGLTCRFRSVDFSGYLRRHRLAPVKGDLYLALNELVRAGHLTAETVQLPPMELKVWRVQIQSDYLKLSVELDQETT